MTPQAEQRSSIPLFFASNTAAENILFSFALFGVWWGKHLKLIRELVFLTLFLYVLITLSIHLWLYT